MALDEPKKEDEVFEEGGTRFIIDKDLFNQAKPINVDFITTANNSGFKITSSLQPAEGGCGSSCGSC